MSEDMNDVKQTLKPLNWSSTVRVIDKSSTLPMVVKPTPATAEKYGISQSPILLHHFWIAQRIVAQNVEMEGTYVVGPQMEISSDFTGTFQYRHDEKGNSDLVQVFSSVKEIASAMPKRVFPQERFVVYPASAQEILSNGEKVKSLVLQPREQLTVFGKQDVTTAIPVNRVPFGFGGKTRFKHVTVPCVTFYNETSKELLNLPLSTKGKFCTLSHIPSQGREFDFKDILREIDVPINLITCRNCPQTLLDEHFLRPAMRLRFTAIEEHEVILGVTTQEKIVEFASEGVEFLLPEHLALEVKDREQEILYQTALQRFLMECQIKNSQVNIKDYRKSIRNHVSRTVRLTSPKPLSLVASYRDCRYVMPTPAQNGVSAIALLSSSLQNPVSGLRRRSSLPNDGTSRPAMPLPGPPSNDSEPTPPLPPRNTRLASSVRYSPRPFSVVDLESSHEAPPSRPPPLPPYDVTDAFSERPKSYSLSSCKDSKDDCDDDVWEMLDEKCLQRLRAERNSVRRRNHPNAYENTSDLMVPKAAGAPSSLDLMALHHTTSLDDIERPSSPEFDASTHELVPPNAPHPTPVTPLPENSFSPISQIGDNQRSADSVALLDESDGLDVPPRSPIIQAEVLVARPAVPTRTTSIWTEASVEYGNIDIRPMLKYDTEVSAVQIEEPVATSPPQMSPPSTPEIEHPPKSHYENICIREMEPAKSDGLQEEKHYDLANAVTESASTTFSRDNESSSSSTSPKHSTESESTTQSDTKDSPTSSTNSLKASNGGFHVSRYSVVSDDSNPSLQHISFTCNYMPSPTDWIPPTDLSDMSVDDVANSMRYIGMNEDTVEWFRAEKVDGQLLCLIEDDAITDHFRLSPFQRKKLAMFLKGWRPKL